MNEQQRSIDSARRLLPGVPLIESPLFRQALDEMDLNESELAVAVALNERGYAILDFPDADFDARTERIKTNLAPNFTMDLQDSESIKNDGNGRIQDAWKVNDDVKAIATNGHVLALLAKLYGRRAIPFQTLNFPVGTQQPAHSDSIHFSCMPERFMCGVWVAMEDVGPDAGPLTYFPGSHKWPIVHNSMIGQRRWNDRRTLAQEPYQAVWKAMLEAERVEPEIFLARKGQALIWAANLLHGGSERNDLRQTRWSQVTHYYFEDCIYYTPAYSDEALGRYDLRTIVNIENGEVEANAYLGEPLITPRSRRKKGLIKRLLGSRITRELPGDFDPEVYRLLNPDVAAAGHNAALHYLRHGIPEGRRYRI